MSQSIFIERSDKPLYLLVGEADSVNGAQHYISTSRVLTLLKGWLDEETYTEINMKMLQETLNDVYGEGKIDLEKERNLIKR